MGLNLSPTAKLAKKIYTKHSLSIPFDLKKLAECYAEVIYRDIPISGVDGVSVNLKVIGKKPRIIVNSNLPATRQLFTLAHELGHVIIPWHTGTIVDDVYNSSYKDYIYFALEQEANLFASELLMPCDWILISYNNLKPNLAALHKLIVDTVGVSDHAAAISMIKALPPDIIYIAEQENHILHSGKTENTNATLPESNQQLSENQYPYINSHTRFKSRNVTYHWFDLNAKVFIEINDTREWRQVLHEIASDIQPIEGVEKFKKSVNGIVSFANGRLKMNQSEYSVDSLITACLYRFERNGFEKFVAHSDFKSFVKLRAQDFFK